MSSQRTGRHSRWAGQKHLRILVSHAARKVAIRRADAFDAGLIDATERIHRSTQTCRTTRIFCHSNPSIDDNLPDGLVPPARALEVINDFGSRRHTERINTHTLAFEDACEFDEIAGFAPCTRADISSVELDLLQFLRPLALTRVRVTRHSRSELGQIHDEFVNKS